jgi:hypothetical protein
MKDGIKIELGQGLDQKRRPTKLLQAPEFILSDYEIEALAFAYSLEPKELRAEARFDTWLRCRHAGQANANRMRWDH